MKFIERPNMNAVYFLNSIPYTQFKTECIEDAKNNGEKKPTEVNMKTWYSILKQFCKANIKTKGITTRIYSHSQTTPAGGGGRLFSGGSMQGIWGVYRGLLMRGIGTDIDMCNCHPVILKYVCKKHDILCPILEYYINNRDECLSQFPTRTMGKNAFLVATNNDKHVTGYDIPKVLKQYDKEMKDIQKQLVELDEYKQIQECIPEYKQSKTYNGSVINRILCEYENEILQHAKHVINSRNIEVVIPMFDGVMVYGDHYNDSGLLDEISKYVDEQIPDLNMKWAYKEHDDTLQIPDDFKVAESTTDGSFKSMCEDF